MPGASCLPAQLCLLSTYISAVAFLFEFLAWARLAPVVVSASGRPLSLMRYIMWWVRLLLCCISLWRGALTCLAVLP